MNQLVIMYACKVVNELWPKERSNANKSKVAKNEFIICKVFLLKEETIILPVVDSGSVGKWFVKHLSTDGLCGGVAPRMEDAPPNVVSFTRGSRCRWSRGSHRGCRCRRHRQRLLQLATFSFINYMKDQTLINYKYLVLASSLSLSLSSYRDMLGSI